MRTADAIKGNRQVHRMGRYHAFCFIMHALSSLDKMTKLVSSYTFHLINLIIPTSEAKVFPNNKPLLNKVKDALHMKHRGSPHCDSKDKIGAKREVRFEIKRAKQQYRSKI